MVLLMSNVCFAGAKECNSIVKRIDPLMREYIKMRWTMHAMDVQTLIKDYGSIERATVRGIALTLQLSRIFEKAIKLTPKCDYYSSKKWKATTVYSNKLKNKYGF